MKNSHNSPSNVVKNTTQKTAEKPKKPSKTQKIREFLLLLLPACFFCSAFPQIHLGSTESMNLEISIPELWLVFFSVASLSNLPEIWQKHHKHFLISGIFPLFVTLSLFWSANRLRGLLTVGLLWSLWFAIWNLILTIKKAPKIFPPKLRTAFLTTSLIFSAVVWLQCILDVLGVPRDTSLLCLGCTSTAFGFPHPNGFTLEPQFMGNLLLAPALYSLELYLKAPKDEWQKRYKYLLLFAIFAATLFLTFSRGAIFAFGIAVVVTVIMELIQAYKQRRAKNRTNEKSKFGSSLLTIPVFIVAFIFTLCAQGIFAELGPTSETFTSATAASIHQLSLGKIDLRSKKAEKTSETDTTSAVFDGYVEESTNVRVDLTNKALDLWNDSLQNIILGVGIGGSGESLYEKFPELGSPKEIVQNEYVALLLELGVLGYLCLIVSIAPFIKRAFTPVKKSEKSSEEAPKTLELSYLITLFFFSGLPNALHIYIFPALLNTKRS